LCQGREVPWNRCRSVVVSGPRSTLGQVSLPRSNQQSGPLAGHVRRGRTYQSRLAATGVLHVGDWVRDDLPDLLWPVLTLAELGTHEAVRFVRWQQAVQTDLAGQAEPNFLAECLDGRLTSLDRLVSAIPAAKPSIKKRAAEWGILSDKVAKALASYPLRPAEWLTDLEMAPPDQPDVDLLAKAVLEVLKDGHREAVIKCLYVWSAVQAGTFSADSETIALLKYYPTDEGSRSKVDTVVRASWGAHHGRILHNDPDRFAESINWAKKFWGVNSMTTRCMRRRDTESDDILEALVNTESSDETAEAGDGAHLQQFAMDLLSSYVEALETSPARLYDREPQEVHSGMVARVGRDVITALGVRDLWCMEHGAHIIRALVEVRIYLQWMAQQDAAIYRAYQDYGAGKAKLYARIMNELPDEARGPDFRAAIGELENLSHNSNILDHRVVDTSDSFADGKSIRAMAEECGLFDLYRRAYYMASGVAHSEWWSIETHAMERCSNVLHGGHLIPSLSLNAGGNVELATSWVDQLYALIRASLRILGTDGAAIANAFAWLESDDEDSDLGPPEA
jgi:hypothetical protein